MAYRQQGTEEKGGPDADETPATNNHTQLHRTIAYDHSNYCKPPKTSPQQPYLFQQLPRFLQH